MGPASQVWRDRDGAGSNLFARRLTVCIGADGGGGGRRARRRSRHAVTLGATETGAAAATWR
jgi:hypothetical protein